MVHRLRLPLRRLSQMIHLRSIPRVSARSFLKSFSGAASQLLFLAFCASCLTADGRTPFPVPVPAPNADVDATAMAPLLEARKNVAFFFEHSANVVCGESIT